MQFWFSRNSRVTLREQLVTQIKLGILSGDLAPGQKLPSTRELARRFRLHPNTISAGYSRLQREEWLKFRRGSGVYVRAAKPAIAQTPHLELDRLVAELFHSVRTLNVPLAEVRLRLKYWMELQPPDHFVLIEPDQDLRSILLFEMNRAVKMPSVGSHLGDPNLPQLLQNAMPVVLPGSARSVSRSLNKNSDLLILQMSSVPMTLARWLPAPKNLLLAIASSWPGFLKLARTLLTASGFAAECLVFRDAGKTGWERGLKEASAVVCDSATAERLPERLRTIAFPLLSEAAIADLRRYAQFVASPLQP